MRIKVKDDQHFLNVISSVVKLVFIIGQVFYLKKSLMIWMLTWGVAPF